MRVAGFSEQPRSSGCIAGHACAEIVRDNAGYGEGFGSLGQRIDAAPLRGKTIHVRAAVSADVPSGSEARIWVAATGPGPGGPTSSLAVDDMRGRGITEPKWRTYDVTITVPANAVTVEYGAALLGAGRCVVDDFSVAVAQ
ncbi:MAG: family peptidase [bacterium]|nr:family peptidase [bacterium]